MFSRSPIYGMVVEVQLAVNPIVQLTLRYIMRISITIILSLFMIGSLLAQSGKIFPDSLEEITVSGSRDPIYR